MKKKTLKTESPDLAESQPGKQIPDRTSDEARGAPETGSSDKPESSEGERRVDSSVAICQANERLFRERKIGSDRPLGQLQRTEAQLKKRARAQRILSAPKPKGHEHDLLIYQIDRALNTGGASHTIAEGIRRDNLALYASLESSDAIESILDRHIVTMSNAAMECHYRSTFGTTQSFDVYARHAEKMTKALIELIETRERRRRPKQVVVGNVNVEAGGQAIVGTVEAHEQRSRSDDDASDDSMEP
jgi:hypothetical protein